MRVRLLAATAALVALSCAPVRASVYMDSGALHISHTDLTLRAGHLPASISSFKRLYSSDNTYSGTFGYGWESRYEDFVRALIRQVVVFEYGGGAINRFNDGPTAPGSFAALPAAEDQLGRMDSAHDDQTMNGTFFGTTNTDVESSLNEMLRLSNLGFNFHFPPPPVGEAFVSSRFGPQTLTRNVDGYERERPQDGYTEDFDLNGDLRRVFDSSGDYIAFTRDGTGALTSVSDSGGEHFAIRTQNRHLVSIRRNSNDAAKYTYSAAGDLLAFQSRSVNERYAYDRYHNLVRYVSNGKSESIAYDSRQDVKSITRSDGTVICYTFTQGESAGSIASSREAVYHNRTTCPRAQDGVKPALEGGYDGDGNLLRVADAGGYAAAATYDKNGYVSTITRGGKTLTIVYDGDNVTSYDITGLGKVTFVYDESGAFSHLSTGDDRTVRDAGEAMRDDFKRYTSLLLHADEL